MADNESAVIIGSIILDTEAPTGYIYINSDASSTSTETVTLNINAIDFQSFRFFRGFLGFLCYYICLDPSFR